MSLISRLFRQKRDPREALRPLWHRVVEIAREPEWYANHGVADTVAGRFDMITAILAIVLIRMEREAVLLPIRRDSRNCSSMTWMAMRESGVGDVVVGKHMGKLMSVLGGRLGAYREGLEQGGSVMDQAITRNMTVVDGHSPAGVASGLVALSQTLQQIEPEALLDGIIPR